MIEEEIMHQVVQWMVIVLDFRLLSQCHVIIAIAMKRENFEF
jgi:hypothetical protein